MTTAARTAPRRRLSVDDRRRELLRACLRLIGERPWDEVSMADVARAAGASKPLLYHYFPTKRELYLAAVGTAADELRTATTPPADLPIEQAQAQALAAHLDWIEANADAYRVILQGGISSHVDVQAIIEASRTDVIDRLALALHRRPPTPAQRTVLRGWVGFLEGACHDWLVNRDLTKDELVVILLASLTAVTEPHDA